MVGHLSGLHKELRKVNESEVQFARRVRRMANHIIIAPLKMTFQGCFIFVIVVFFFQNHFSGCLSGQKVSRKKKKKPWKKF